MTSNHANSLSAGKNSVDAAVVLPLNVLSSLIAMAGFHIADIESGLEDGTYARGENLDLQQKTSMLEHAQEVYRAAMLVPAPVGSGEVSTDWLNPTQREVLNTYARGEFAYLAGSASEEAFNNSIDQCGDGLLKFLIVELSTGQDCVSGEEAVRRLESAQREVASAADSVADAPDWYRWTEQTAGNWTIQRRGVLYTVMPVGDGLWQAWGFKLGGLRIATPQSLRDAKAACESHRW